MAADMLDTQGRSGSRRSFRPASLPRRRPNDLRRRPATMGERQRAEEPDERCSPRMRAGYLATIVFDLIGTTQASAYGRAGTSNHRGTPRTAAAGPGSTTPTET